MLDIQIPKSYLAPVTDGQAGYEGLDQPCSSIATKPLEIIISSKIASGWGGPRANSGGPRPNSGGARPNTGGSRPNTGGVRPGAGRPRKEPKPRSELLPPDIAGVPWYIPGDRWYCFECFFGMAFVAEEELSLAGYETVLPRERVEVIRRRAHKEYREIIIRPLFGRYGFVKLDMGSVWMPAAHAAGVKRLFGRTPERPTPIPVGKIEDLLSRMDPDGVVISGRGIQPIRPVLAPIERDAPVQILEGPFTDWAAVCEISMPDRVTVLLELMGGKRRVTLPRAAVKVVGE